MTPARLSNAPITEALIDIRVDPPDQADLSRLSVLYERISARYPTKKERIQWAGQITMAPGGLVNAHPPQIIGHILTSVDGLHVLQPTLSGFTFSRLHPYDSWESFRDEARDLWKLYIDTIRPRQITRVAVRFINQIKLPVGRIKLSDWILTYPEVAPYQSCAMSEFFMRLVTPNPELDAVAIVTEAIGPTPEDGTQPTLVFDIDVYRHGEFGRDEEIWDALESLRSLKNEIFFKSLTDKALEQYR